MYGELTDKETISRLEYTLENQLQDQFEVLLYKSNSKLKTFYLPFVSVALQIFIYANAIACNVQFAVTDIL